MRGMVSAVVLAAMLPGGLAAQTAAEACAAVRQVKVGQWSSYRMSGHDQGPSEMRLAIVGTEQAEGKAHYWFELKMTTSEGPMIMQVLTPEFPYEQGTIRAMVMKAGDQPAMKMPAQMMGMMNQQAAGASADAWRKCGEASVVGWETVTVPAGSMRALHLKIKDGGDAWVSPDVPFGMVKYAGAEHEEIVLVGHGADAKSSITEKPMDMPGMR
jgi:hypothetical protein